MNELNRNISDFLMARDMDKNELIRYIMGGGQGGNQGYAEGAEGWQCREEATSGGDRIEGPDC